MTDKEFAIQKSRIQKLKKKWHNSLGLLWWKVDYVYYRDEKIDGEHCEAGWSVTANCSVKWEYRDAKIRFDMQSVSGLTDEELEKVYVHECCHIIVNQMREWAPEHIPEDRQKIGMKSEEAVVTALENAFRWVYSAGADSAKISKKKK
jgi:hypothetical protein